MKTVMIKVHEAWLEMSMAAFMSNHMENKQSLFHFADILFRHFCWLEHELIEIGESYNYDRDNIPVKVERLSDLLKNIIARLNEIDLQLISSPDKALSGRISGDIHYMIEVLHRMEDEYISAFDMHRTLPGTALSTEARDALTRFLFEESYKEYELIMIYNYLRAHMKEPFLIRVFQVLIDESFYHFKAFGEMMAKMGILAVPRIVMKELYQIEDIVGFLKAGINEELAAKEECRNLSEAVGKESKTLAMFFDFINNQEDYHITLMKDALAYFEKKGTDV